MVVLTLLGDEGMMVVLSGSFLGPFWGLWWCLQRRLELLRTSVRVSLVRRAHLNAFLRPFALCGAQKKTFGGP